MSPILKKWLLEFDLTLMLHCGAVIRIYTVQVAITAAPAFLFFGDEVVFYKLFVIFNAQMALIPILLNSPYRSPYYFEIGQ